ncbi:MAG: type III-B CRISPR-associated protein Cas10/Cmr2 [Ktedonobacteraceae bacterium]
MEQYLFLVSIGPVQTFIASTRRTRDLHFGSWLLSDLAKVAAKEIVEINNLENLIFPAPHSLSQLAPDNPFSGANKILASIESSPQVLGDKIQQAILTELRAIRDKAYKDLGDFYQEDAFKQVDDLVEYAWVALPFNGNDYDKTRKQLESLMAARKNTRDFAKVTWGNHHPKSSIDGQFESVIPEDKYPRRGDSEGEKIDKARALYRHFRASSAERLSGVDLLKRRGIVPTMPNFPSTSHIATLPYLDRLKQIAANPSRDILIQAKSLWETYINAVKILSKDKLENSSTDHPIIGFSEGSLLFEERLVDLLDFVQEKDKTQYQKVQKALQQFFTFVDSCFPDKRHPDPYYAILHADGDHMGQIISELAKEGSQRHRELSQALDSFAINVPSIVEDSQGALVYAGGDDVLAFLPLHTVLECAKKLAEKFQKELASFKNADGISPTLSVGIAIVHHLHPLSDALNIARAAEKTAKTIEGKNALAITVRKRSGGEYTVANHWKVLDTHVEELSHDYYTDAIPKGTAYELREMVLRLTELTIPSDNPDYQTLQNAIQAEVRRILQRKLGISQKMLAQQDDNSKAKIAIYYRLLTMLDMKTSPEGATAQQQTVDPPSKRVEQVVNTLLVAQLFADAKKLAEPQQEILGVTQ